MRREETRITSNTLSVSELGNKTSLRRHPKMRWLDRLESDMRIYDINPDIASDRQRWSVMVKNLDTT